MSLFNQYLNETGLGFYLLNIVMEVTAVTAIGVLMERLLRRYSAPTRYAVLLIALMFVLASPGSAWLAKRIGAGSLRISRPTPETTVYIPPQISDYKLITTPIVKADLTDQKPLQATVATALKSSPNWPAILLQACIAVWAIGIAVGLYHFARGFRILSTLTSSLRPPRDPKLAEASSNAMRILELAPPPPVISVSPLLPTPLSLGVLRPIIIFPEILEHTLDEDQIQAVVLHEAAHIAHRDHIIGLLQRCTCTIFWWHPLVWMLSGKLSETREEICDNHVLKAQGGGHHYARCLLDLAERTTQFHRLPMALGMIHPRRNFEERIKNLLRKDRNTMTRLNIVAGIFVASFGIMSGGAMLLCNVRAEVAEAPKDASVINVDEKAKNAAQPKIEDVPQPQSSQHPNELPKNIIGTDAKQNTDQRRQWYEKVFGVPVTAQGLLQPFLNLNHATTGNDEEKTSTNGSASVLDNAQVQAFPNELGVQGVPEAQYVTRSYDIGSLIPIQDFPDPFFNPPETQPTSASATTTQRISDVMKKHISPELWDDAAAIHETNGKLIVSTQRPEFHRHIRELLAKMLEDRQVMVLVNIMTFNGKNVLKHLEEIGKHPDDIITEQRKLFTEVINKDKAMLMPELVAYSGQLASAFVLKQIPYVSEYNQNTGQPIKKTASDGFHFQVKGLVSSDRKSIAMDLKCAFETLVRMDKKETPKGMVERPVMLEQRMEKSVTIPDGAAIILELPGVKNDEKEVPPLYILISPRVIIFNEDEDEKF